jgi:hypothetical protein
MVVTEAILQKGLERFHVGGASITRNKKSGAKLNAMLVSAASAALRLERLQ